MPKSAPLEIERGAELIERLTKALGESKVDGRTLARLRAAAEALLLATEATRVDPEDEELVESLRRRRAEAHAAPGTLLSWEETEARFDREVEQPR